MMKAVKVEELACVSAMAADIWRECYASILSGEQIEYMLDVFLSIDALKKQILEGGYEYFFIEYEGKKAGFVGVRVEGKRLFLSKLYIIKDYRGKGLSRIVLDALERKCSEEKLQAIYLTVNKYNNRAYDIYIKNGYEVIDDVVTGIGNGYVMDDYVMQKNIQ